MKGSSFLSVQRSVQAFIMGVILVGVTPGLLGHAQLVQTVPPANARLEQAPKRVLLLFNEGIESIFNLLTKRVKLTSCGWDDSLVYSLL